LPSFKTSGSFKFNKNNQNILKLKNSIKKASFLSNKHKLKAYGIYLNLPLVFNFNKKMKNKALLKYPDNGRLSISKIYYDQQNIAKFKTAIYQKPFGALFKGNLEFKSLSSSKNSYKNKPEINFKSEIEISPDNKINAESDFKFKKIFLSSELITQSYLSSYLNSMPEGMAFDAFISSEGKVKFDKNKLSTKFKLNITQGQVAIPEKKFYMKNINTGLELQDILNIRSMPGQSFTIDKIDFNDIKLSDINLKYNIESKDSLLIENAGFKWCDGNITTESIRFSLEKDKYNLILFCDRLKLSEILKQVGNFYAEGDGSLNGRIPISYFKGNISFDNGFLYSTPGKGGKIKIKGTDILTAGIPMNTPQFIQIDLAREALKNYEYDWAKLGFNTQNQELIVKMQFNGKPENKLPFVYKKNLGRFVRVGAQSPGSNFQGINIDVNLRIPFNKVLKFGNQINNLLN